jgi:BirA family biotin operon repressor/biotin-[acetyl-CoA-carboxylase] ligase
MRRDAEAEGREVEAHTHVEGRTGWLMTQRTCVQRRDFVEIDSTNLEAERLWKEEPSRKQAILELQQGVRSAWLLVARVQTRGKGRQGRTWFSPAGGLWFSLLWPLRFPLQRYAGISLAAGWAVSEAIQSVSGLECRIKWPNDLLVRERKICGILCETTGCRGAAAAIIGVGVNANFGAAELPAGLRWSATTLLDELGRPVDLDRLTTDCSRRLVRALDRFERDGLKGFRPRIEGRLAWVGEPVVCEGAGHRCLRGELEGVDPEGRLLLRCEGTLRTVAAGDLVRAETESIRSIEEGK